VSPLRKNPACWNPFKKPFSIEHGGESSSCKVLRSRHVRTRLASPGEKRHGTPTRGGGAPRLLGRGVTSINERSYGVASSTKPPYKDQENWRTTSASHFLSPRCEGEGDAGFCTRGREIIIINPGKGLRWAKRSNGLTRISEVSVEGEGESSGRFSWVSIEARRQATLRGGDCLPKRGIHSETKND